MTTSTGGSRSNSTPGGTHRFGPTNWTGDARVLQTGSMRMFTPASCRRKLVCPTQVMVKSFGAARGTMKLGSSRGKDSGSGSGRRGFRRRSTSDHLRKSRNPCCRASGHGFRNPPSGRWWEAAVNLSPATGYHVATNIRLTSSESARISSGPRLDTHRWASRHAGKPARQGRPSRFLDVRLNKLHSHSSAVAEDRRAVSQQRRGDRSP